MSSIFNFLIKKTDLNLILEPIEEKPIIEEPTTSEKISLPSVGPVMKGRPRKSQDGMDLNKSKPLNKANSTLVRD